MTPPLIASFRTLLVDPDRPDLDALFAVLNNEQVSDALACLVPTGTLAQLVAALHVDWSWCLEGWEWQIAALVAMITDPRCPRPNLMLETWSHIPNAVGILRDRTDDLIAWAEQRLNQKWYDDLATVLGPSDASARLLVQSSSSPAIGRTLRRWSMATDSTDPTAWQAIIDADLRQPLRRKAAPSWAFPAWGADNAVDSGSVLDEIVVDLVDGWSPDHPSLRERIAWLEHHVDSNLYVSNLARVAIIGRSDALAEEVCVRFLQNHGNIWEIVRAVPWSRLHPQIQTVIDETMQQESDRWKRTWACALGQAPLVPDATIDAILLMWRIAPERWNDLDPSIRAALMSSIDPHSHCYGWGVHPDLVTGKNCPKGQVFRFWNPDVPPDDLRAWAYADLLRAQSTLQEVRRLITLQEARGLITFLMTLPPNRHARFEQIIDWRFGERMEATTQPPWDWAGWGALPAADRQRRLRDRLHILWGDRATLPAVRCWRARNDGLATLALMVSEILGIDDPTPILAALLAQVLVLQMDMTDVGPSPPFPDDLDAARRAQIERLPLARDAQAYATWGLWLLARAEDVGADLLALHPDVAVALAPLLTADQQKAVAVSLAAQGWESMTHLRWVAACAPAQEQPMPPIQRRIL